MSAMPGKAMLLAAGKGTRLRPLTETVAKCMVEVAGKPVLEHNIEWLRRYGVTELVINLHYLPQEVINYFGDGSRFGVRITYSYEEELLGTAGAVKKVEAFFDSPFFVWYADNLSTCRLDRLWEFHQAKGGKVTLALHHRDDPTQSGIVGLDSSEGITRFLEKPQAEELFSHWVNAGIFVLDPSVLALIPSGVAFDFGRDVFPKLLERGVKLYGYRMSKGEGLWWIDTVSDLQKVQTLIADLRAVQQKELA
jgi:NDP-sugar pyrophosphorylase family protein